MVPNMTTILQRFTGEWAMLLQPEAILTVCREIGYTAWRDRVLTPVTTMQLFLLQILHGNTACSHLPHLSGLRFTAAAYCQARAKLPLRFFALLLERFGSAVQRSALDEGRWHGHRTVSRRWLGMLHARYPDPTGRVRPANGAAAGVRLSCGATAGAVPCGDRGAPEAGGRAPPDPRSGPGAGGPSELTTRGCTRGRSGPVFLRPSRPPRPGRRACRAARRRATDRGFHARSALCQAECAADTGGQRHPTIPLAQNARRP